MRDENKIYRVLYKRPTWKMQSLKNPIKINTTDLWGEFIRDKEGKEKRENDKKTNRVVGERKKWKEKDRHILIEIRS